MPTRRRDVLFLEKNKKWNDFLGRKVEKFANLTGVQKTFSRSTKTKARPNGQWPNLPQTFH